MLLGVLGISGVNGVGYQGPFSPRIAQRSIQQIPATVTVTITPSGLHAGGQHNIIVQDPDTPTTWYAASDVGSLEKSTDNCASWFPCSAGIVGRTGVAALAFNPSNHNEWGLLTGKVDAAGKTATGAFYRSTDRCATWSLRSTQCVGAGNGSFSDAGSGTSHLRSVGKLIFWVGANIYVGSFGNDAKGGLRKSTDSGATWTGFGSLPANSYIQGMALDTDGTTLVIGLIDTSPVYTTNGIYKVDTGTGTTTKLAGSGTSYTSIHHCEEMWICPTHVRIYAICNTAGLWYSTDHGTTWTLGATLSGAPQWCSITGVHSANDTIYVGCVGAGSLGSGAFGTLYTFSNPTSGSGTSLIVAGAGFNCSTTVYLQSFTWWENGAFPNNMLGRSNCNANQIAIDSSDSTRIVIATTAGAWITVDTGAHFSPCVYHMIGCAPRTGAVDPTNPNRVCVWLDDPNFAFSSDGFVTIDQQSPNGASIMGGVAIADDGTVWASIGKAGPTRQILSNPDPTNHAGWTDESVGAGFASNPYSFLPGRDSTGARLVDALDPPNGVYRRAGGAWSHPVAGPPFAAIPPGSGLGCPPVQVAGTGVIVRFDPNKGVYKSVDYGATEVAFWTDATVFPGSGAAVSRLHIDAGGHLYVLVNHRLYRIDGAQTLDATKTVDGGQLSAIGILTNVDAFGMSPSGVLLAATTPVDAIGGTLLRSRDLGTTWPSVGGPTYPAISPNIEWIGHTDAGKAYLGSNGMGAFVVTGV